MLNEYTGISLVFTEYWSRSTVMQTIGTPLQCPDLGLSPEHKGGIRLSDDMQQVLSLLCGFVKNQRVPLRCSPNGILETTSAKAQDVKHYTGSGANDTQSGSDLPCSEILCMAHPDNTGMVWVRTGGTAATNNSWPLAKGEYVRFAVDNLSRLRMLIVVDAEKLIVLVA